MSLPRKHVIRAPPRRHFLERPRQPLGPSGYSPKCMGFTSSGGDPDHRDCDQPRKKRLCRVTPGSSVASRRSRCDRYGRTSTLMNARFTGSTPPLLLSVSPTQRTSLRSPARALSQSEYITVAQWLGPTTHRRRPTDAAGSRSGGGGLGELGALPNGSLLGSFRLPMLRFQNAHLLCSTVQQLQIR